MNIPFHEPYITGDELKNILDVFDVRKFSSDSKYSKLCEAFLEEKLACNKAIITTSATSALEASSLILGLKPGDEVIMPSFTFVSTANAFVLSGVVPVFVDIDPETLNINPNEIEKNITAKTKAIVPVHYAGVPCHMDAINQISIKNKIAVIEDAAQSIMSRYRNHYLGTIGDIGVLSFHETKNISSGEGGALLINNEELIEKAKIVCSKGTNRDAFFSNKIDYYTWIDKGSSYKANELTSAFLYAQLLNTDKIISFRRRMCALYRKKLSKLSCQSIYLPKFEGNGHIFYLITRTSRERDNLITYLRKKNINSVFHFIPLHSSPGGVKYGRYSSELKNTDSLSKRILRLPLYNSISEKEIEIVCEEIINFYKL